MKTGKTRTVMLIILTLMAGLSGCAKSTDNRNVVYEDMQAAFEKVNLLSANVGFFKKNGYLLRGELKDVPKGHDCYELYKMI